MEVQSFKEISTFLLNEGKISNIKDLAKKINRHHGNLSQMNGGSIPVTRQIVKLINDTFGTDFVFIKKENPETLGYEECKQLVNRLIDQNLKLQNDYLEVTNKLLEYYNKSKQ
jgi:hypothetical protein